MLYYKVSWNASCSRGIQFYGFAVACTEMDPEAQYFINMRQAVGGQRHTSVPYPIGQTWNKEKD